jgi:hypothetical protein
MSTLQTECAIKVHSVFKHYRPDNSRMNAEEAKAFLKDRGIPTMNYPHGYLLKISRREGSPSRRIEMDELDTILALGKVKLIAVEDTVGDILIEVERKDLIQE